jgi:hypothetical protein
MFALCANVNVFCTDPVSVVTTFFTYKPIRPSGLRQVIVTGVDIAKALVKFNFGFGKIFFDRKIYHGGLLFLWLRPLYPLDVTDTVTPDDIFYHFGLMRNRKNE